MEAHNTRYVKTPDGTYIAYQVAGDGPVDLVWNIGWPGNLDIEWEFPWSARWMRGLASFSRLILHDDRGVGLSSRNVAVPNLETRAADLRVVLDAVSAKRAVLGGYGIEGAVNALVAASDPDLVHSIVWVEPGARASWAADYPWGMGPDFRAADLAALEHWGTSEYGRQFVEGQVPSADWFPENAVDLVGLQSRNACTPDVAQALSLIWYATDVRGILPSVQTPTLLLTGSAGGGTDEAEYVASLMPNAELITVAGDPFSPQRTDNRLQEVRRFVGLSAPVTGLDTFLTTVMFTDIVGSTTRQAALGDLGWKELVEQHHALVRTALDRWQGEENDTAGDGFYASFDGPARAIHCALDIVDRVRELGIEVRAGVHIGSCELIDGKVGGITVSIGARIAAMAASSEVLVSRTVKDLVPGSGLSFEDAGEHDLKGIPDRWHLYRVVS
jgi:class 3 adenylate cyclase